SGNDFGGPLDGQLYLTYLLNMDGLSQTFSALADPTRRAILARLATGAATVGELAEPFDMSLPAVSRHLRVLTDAGLIERHTEAQWRRCELRGEAFRSWFGPVGMKTVLCEVDPKVGGAWRLMGEGKEIPGKREPGLVRPTVSGKYLEIEPPTRLVFTFAWHEKDDFASPRGQETIV